MSSKPKNSEIQILENSRVALTNVEQQPAIAETMALYSFTPEELSIGKQLLIEAQNAYNHSKQEKNETLTVKIDFNNKSKIINLNYRLHRRRAKVAFRKEEVILKKLALTGSLPVAYVKWIECMKTFYNGILADESLQEKMARFQVSKEEMETNLNAITDLENLRSTYLREIGESQEATQSKDAAFAKLDHWMQDFYAVAKIAMEDKPQLLEAIGILVRS